MQFTRFALVATGSVCLGLGYVVYLIGILASGNNRIVSPLQIAVIILTQLTGFVCIFLSGIKEVRRFGKLPILAVLALFVAASAGLILTIPRYPTDAAAFQHYAALVFLRGGNPYSESMAPSLQMFNVPAYWTPNPGTELIGGGVETHFSYPSLYFLLYVPFIAAGLGDVRWIGLGAVVAAIAVVYKLSSPAYKPLVAIFLLFDLGYMLEVAEGPLDSVWLLFLALTLGLRRSHPKWSALALGLAIAYKETAWIFFPFFTILLAKEAGRRAVFRTVSLSLGVFAITNIPFVVLNPNAYSASLFASLGAVSTGSGLSLLTQAGLFALSSTSYLYLMIVTTVTSLGLYWRFHDELKAGGMMFPGLTLFLGWRSLHRYIIWWIFLVLILLSEDADGSVH